MVCLSLHAILLVRKDLAFLDILYVFKVSVGRSKIPVQNIFEFIGKQLQKLLKVNVK